MHLGACHFVGALGIPGVLQSKRRVQKACTSEDTAAGDTEQDENEEGKEDEDFDVDTSMEVEASEDDLDAVREASVTDFDAGDVVGKLMALISQLRLCGEDTRDYLKYLSLSNGSPDWEIKLWVRTRWGSLSDCFKTVLAIRKVTRSLFLFVLFTYLLRNRVLTFFAKLRTTMTIFRHYQMGRSGFITSSRLRSGNSSSSLRIVSRFMLFILRTEFELNLRNRYLPTLMANSLAAQCRHATRSIHYSDGFNRNGKDFVMTPRMLRSSMLSRLV